MNYLQKKIIKSANEICFSYKNMYLHVNIVDGVADVLEDRLERHEQVAVLEAVLNPTKDKIKFFS